MNGHEDEKDNTKRSGIIATLITGVATVAVAGLISYYTAQFQVEKQTAITLSYTKEHFDARLREYPKLWEILLPLSTRSEAVTPEKNREIVQKLNEWMYGRGGLVAHEYTRSLVFQLREACANWKSGERPEKISKLKDDIIYSSRNDLYLVARQNVESTDLYKLVRERNEKIRKRQERAGL